MKRLGPGTTAILLVPLIAIGVGAFAATGARADGQLDPSFGSGGSIELSLGEGTGAEGATELFQLGDGRFITIGPGKGNGTWTTQNLSNGGLDGSFGVGGGAYFRQSRYSFGISAAREANGSIVIAGGEVSAAIDFDTLVARLTPQGTLDPSFGDDPPNPTGDGISVFNLGGDDIAEDIAIDSAGRPMLVGRVGPSSDLDAMVLRLQPDGSIDSSFGGPKGISVDLGGNDVATNVATQGERTVVLVSSNSKTFLLAYRSDGSLDATFGGGDGIAPLAFSSEPESNALLVQPDGRILAAAGFGAHISIERVLPDGSPDPGFGSGGITGFDAPNGAKQFLIGDLAQGDDGKIVGAANAFAPGSQAIVLRTLADGQPDPAWGANGVLAFPNPPGHSDTANAVSIGPERRILVGGETFDPEAEEANRLLTRLLGDTTPPDTAITHVPRRRLKVSGKKQGFAFEALGDVNTTFECELTRPRRIHKHKRHRHRPPRSSAASSTATFSACSSPARYGNLRRPGRYRFAVRSIDPAGNVDASPATAAFKVLPKKHHKRRRDG
jgi:uncharacterized delta-60 repeat protein